jgi:CRP-like cAMP-binding protein
LGKSDLIRTIFRITDDEIINEISEIACVRHYEKGESIYKIGEFQTDICILLKGIVYSFFIDEAQNVVTDCFLTESGFPINTENLELPSMFGTEALAATDILQIPIQGALLLMDKYKEVLWEYVRFMQMGMTFHWYIANKRIHYPANERYEWFRKTWPEADKVCSNAQIASFLGIRPETLSRLRHQPKNADKQEGVDILVTKDMKWNYPKMKKALQEGQYEQFIKK